MPKPLTCPSKKCGASLIQQIYVGRFAVEQEEDPDKRPETNRLEMIQGTGTYIYKCVVCGTQAWPIVGK